MPEQQPAGRLSLQDFLSPEPGLHAEVSRVFHTDEEANLLLDRIDFPRGRRPVLDAVGDRESYWRLVAGQIDLGITEGGLEALLAAASHRYPHNPVFGRYAGWRAARPAQGADAWRGASLFVVSGRPADELVGLVRQLAAGLQIPGPVELAVTTQRGLAVLDLRGADGDQAHRLALALRAALPQSSPAQVHTALDAYRATLLTRLIVDGPDQARFELENVPGSVSPREVARAVLDQYADEKFWPCDPRTGLPRQAVIDTDKPTGEAVRLDPDQSLADQGVHEGQTLRVSPESRAGAGPFPWAEDLLKTYLAGGSAGCLAVVSRAAFTSALIDQLTGTSPQGEVTVELANGEVVALRFAASAPAEVLRQLESLREPFSLARGSFFVVEAGHRHLVVQEIIRAALSVWKGVKGGDPAEPAPDNPQ